MSDKMKVLRILNRPIISGPTYHVAYLTAGLSDKFETQLVCGQKQKNEADGTYIFRDNNIDHLTVKNMKRSINPFQDIKVFLELRKIMKDYNPDIVHTHAAKPGTLGRLAARSLGIQTIVHTFHGNAFHGYFSPLITKFFIAIERFLAKKSSAIIAISELQKRELVDKFKISTEEQTFVVPLGLRLDKFKIANSEPKPFIKNTEVTYFTIIGRLTAIKNHKLYIDFIAKLKTKTNENVCGLIVGEGELYEELMQYARGKNLIVKELQEDYSEADIIFAGSQKNINGVLHQSDVVVLTSNNEGTPVTLLEAQAAGKPILATDVGGIKDVTSPDCALLSSSGDSDALVKNALEIMNNMDTYITNAQLNAQVTIDRFSVENLVAGIESLYLHLQYKA